MSQHDYILADAAGASFRADLNAALAAIVSRNSGATAPETTYAYMLWADTTSGVLKRRNAANSAWVIESTLDEAFVINRSSNTILDESDCGKTFVATAGFTQTLTAAATLGDGWSVNYRIESGATVVFDPNASENINGATTLSVIGPASLMIVCNGSAFFTISIEQPASETVQGKVELATNAEALAGTDTARAVTSAGLASSKSLGANGYMRFPGGLMIQWIAVSSDAGGNFSGAWPIAFTSAYYGAVVTDSTSGDRVWHIAGNTSNYGGTCFAGGSVVSSTGFVVAIGRMA